jgi:CheY-like chemotaxis protein
MDSDSVPKPIDVLLVEDSRLQAELVKRTLAELAELNLVAIAEDGVVAMAYLRREGKHRDAVRPELVLLDINMPNKDGFQVLNEMKADPELRRIPVVMLTSSTDDQDIVKSYEDGACTYIPKPITEENLKSAFQFFAHYWTKTARLPFPQDP